MFKGARIYVAGHAGLIGSALVKVLKGGGDKKIILRSHAELDLTDAAAVDCFFRKNRPQYVFLAAGLTGGIAVNKAYPARFLHVNLAIQDNVFEAAQRYAVERLVFYGSSCVYPKFSPQPIKEDNLFKGEPEATSIGYAVAKLSGIVACKAYNEQSGKNRFIALVPNTVYGPNDNFDPNEAHVLPALLRRFNDAKVSRRKEVILWGSGRPKREFIFCDDVARASVFAMANAEKLKNSHYNIGSGVEYSICQLAESIAEIVGFKGKIRWDTFKPDGAPRKFLNSSKFMKLGWRPRIILEQGLRLTYRWFLKETIDNE